jgi:hypothetical protein
VHEARLGPSEQPSLLFARKGRATASTRRDITSRVEDKAEEVVQAQVRVAYM